MGGSSPWRKCALACGHWRSWWGWWCWRAKRKRSDTMNPALEKLVKYLRLEESRGYDDGAVLGGLAKMLEPWRSEAREAGMSEAVLQGVVSRLQDYGRLTPAPA